MPRWQRVRVRVPMDLDPLLRDLYAASGLWPSSSSLAPGRCHCSKFEVCAGASADVYLDLHFSLNKTLPPSDNRSRSIESSRP